MAGSYEINSIQKSIYNHTSAAAFISNARSSVSLYPSSSRCSRSQELSGSSANNTHFSELYSVELVYIDYNVLSLMCFLPLMVLGKQ